MANLTLKFMATDSMERYNALATKDKSTFYLIAPTNGEASLFLGEELLSNDGDLVAALSRISANENAITALQTAVDTLNGTAVTTGSVAKAVADGIAAVVASAPSDFDTLKEISDWISSHGTTAASMNTAIEGLKTLLGAALPNGVSSSTVIDYVGEATQGVRSELLGDSVNDTAASKTIEGLVKKTDATNTALNGLNGSATIVTQSGNRITIRKSVVQSAGEIDNDSDTSNDVVLADVAGSGRAADVAIVDAGNKLESTTVEAALQELATNIGTVANALQWIEF